jgi:glycosyltransferase involved in cell wall biosynthesis
MRILFLVPYPFGQAPSQRFRFEQYLPALTMAGHSYKFLPFLDDKTWHILYQPGHTWRKAWGIIKGFGRRAIALRIAPTYDYVFIHREATPLGPPLYEWLLAKVLRKKVIYDFDDAIWIPNISEANRLANGLKHHQKVANICRWAYRVSCGNAYLAGYARQYNSSVVINPTTIDTENLHNKVRDQSEFGRPVIGWTGTHSTLKYLKQLVPILSELEQNFDFEFRVISNQPPELSLRSLVFIPWRKETELIDLLSFNIGLMPLEDDPWAKGKCAFKALQYMALGIPPVVSPIGMNNEVVQDDVNGFLCATPDEWRVHLTQLLNESALRQRLGEAARETIELHYSVVANTQNFLRLFE